MSPDDPILLRTPPQAGVVVLTLNRPQQRNALSSALRDDIVQALAEAAADAAVGAVVLTGAGDAFCAGFDLRELAQGDARKLFAQARAYHQAVYTFPKPLLAAVNGPALAGGMDLALMCDMRVGTPTATLGQPQVKAGVPAAHALVRAVLGESAARWLCLTGERLDAPRALALGAFAEVVDAHALLTIAVTRATAMAASPAARAMKAAMVGQQAPLFDAHD